LSKCKESVFVTIATLFCDDGSMLNGEGEDWNDRRSVWCSFNRAGDIWITKILFRKRLFQIPNGANKKLLPMLTAQPTNHHQPYKLHKLWTVKCVPIPCRWLYASISVYLHKKRIKLVFY
jgi:hypothetical protein